MKKIILVSGHLFESKRRAGFHLIAESLGKMGHEVIFVTAPYSKLFKLKKHYFNELQVKKCQLVPQGNNISSYVHSTPFHIANLRKKALNKMSAKLYGVYQKFSITKELEQKVAQGDIIIFESTPGLFLLDKFKKINPNAKYVYRVSDDLELLGVHPSLINYEEEVLSKFSLISVPSQYIYDKILGKLAQGKENLKLQYHGIKKTLYDAEHDNPYQKGTVNAVFIGVSRFDYSFLEKASVLRSDILFHIIGPIEPKVKGDNIIYYGEMPFEDTVPYVKHADIGMHTLSYSEGAESFSDSLKVHQYTYCGLPIVAPTFLETKRKNSFYYSPEFPESIEKALGQCIAYNTNRLDLKSEVLSWEQLVNEILNEI